MRSVACVSPRRFCSLLALAAAAAPWIAPASRRARISPRRGAPLAGASSRAGQAQAVTSCRRAALHGGRVSLAVGLTTVAASLVIGAALGAVAGYAGGWLDDLLMRIVDVLLAFPGLLLAIALTAVLGASVRNVVSNRACVIGWTGYAGARRAARPTACDGASSSRWRWPWAPAPAASCCATSHRFSRGRSSCRRLSG